MSKIHFDFNRTLYPELTLHTTTIQSLISKLSIQSNPYHNKKCHLLYQYTSPTNRKPINNHVRFLSPDRAYQLFFFFPKRSILNEALTTGYRTAVSNADATLVPDTHDDDDVDDNTRARIYRSDVVDSETALTTHESTQRLRERDRNTRGAKTPLQHS